MARDRRDDDDLDDRPARDRRDDRDDDYDDRDSRRPAPRSDGGGSAFGIAGMVLGIVSLIVSFIPCFGMYAFFPGVVAVILSSLGMAKARSKGMSIAGLVCSIVAVGIACYWYFTVQAAKDKIIEIHDKGPQIINDWQKNAVKQP